jgi:hypothetical protein
MSNPISKSNRKVRQVFSILAGNLIQGAGASLGCVFLWLSAQPIPIPLRVTAMIAGYGLIYFTTHSSVHYMMGRLGGIRFSHYSIGGSAYASSYPPVMRQIFERLPFFAVHTDRESLRSASRLARGLMFASGIAGTVLFCSLAAWFAFRANVPGGLMLLIVNGVWQVSSLIAELRPGGDLARAANALRS